MNTDLLGRSLWRIGKNSHGFQKDVLQVKYGIGRDWWDIHDAKCQIGNYHYSAVWHDIISVKRDLVKHMWYGVGTDERINFLLLSLGSVPLPNLCRRAQDRKS